jgi:dolichyl-phosphate-mannose--protein O-mannosyl transferase
VSLRDQLSSVYQRFLPFGFWIVTGIAAFLRFFNLGSPKALIFDETYYIKDAWTLAHLGYEGSWLPDSDAKWVSGVFNTFTNSASFIVHPPLGKWLIALPMLVFDPKNTWTWRFSSALFGTLAVVLIMLVAKRLFQSRSAAVLAGMFFAIDGHAIVLARTSLLDNFLMFFALLAFYFLIRDRDDARVKYAVKRSLRDAASPELRDHLSSVIWNRPWLVACAIALGLATGVKWSGLYFAAAFGLYVVLSETLLRKRYGFKNWLSEGILGQGVATLVLMLPVFALTYLATWTGWIITKGGWDRNSKGTWWQSLIQYHQDMYRFHVNLHTPHSYASNPLTWLFMIRPTSFYYESIPESPACPSINGCSSAITAVGNPFIWWGAAAAILYLVVHYARYFNRTEGLILLGFAAGYVPWLFFMQRTIFEFYAIAFLPYTVLALVYVLRSLWYRNKPGGGFPWRRAIVIYLISVGLISFFYLSEWWGFTTPYWYWLIHMWLPSWI